MGEKSFEVHGSHRLFNQNRRVEGDESEFRNHVVGEMSEEKKEQIREHRRRAREAKKAE